MSAVAFDSLWVTLDGYPALRGIGAVIAEREWVALIGPNGAGKSTLLRAIAGLVPHRGELGIAGRHAEALRQQERARHVAFVPQTPLLPAEMPVAEYVLLGRTPYIGYLGTEGRRDLEAVERTLARLDLTGFARRRLGSLSGGERQRAVLARALAQEAPLLLLDEPTASLDVGRQQQALELVDVLRAEQGLTVLTAMHDLNLAARYADRLLFLAGGRLVAEGSAADVLSEELIALHYGATVRVLDEDGLGVTVVPTRPAPVR
ncbi:MAG TPA: ABC transporter ATP-binding protein [Gaiellaceae bacterium]|nr:ABC transporter ATP-binding protein [Gaiellaceae bacterium]